MASWVPPPSRMKCPRNRGKLTVPFGLRVTSGKVPAPSPRLRLVLGQPESQLALSACHRYTPPVPGAWPRFEKDTHDDGLAYCDGCDRGFDSPEYLQLDHNTPRADEGSNNLSNRRPQCGPCNRRKAHKLTLSGLRDRNRKDGFMAS